MLWRAPYVRALDTARKDKQVARPVGLAKRDTSAPAEESREGGRAPQTDLQTPVLRPRHIVSGRCGKLYYTEFRFPSGARRRYYYAGTQAGLLGFLQSVDSDLEDDIILLPYGGLDYLISGSFTDM